MNSEAARFYEAVESFWLRPFENDVHLLNISLAKAGRCAGIELFPPSVLTGDPFQLPEGNCLLVLGMNPKWQGNKAAFLKYDLTPAKSAYEERNFC